MKLSRRSFLAGVAAAFCGLASVWHTRPAMQFIWTGAAGDADWRNPLNFEPHGRPRAGDTVVFDRCDDLPRLLQKSESKRKV